MLTQLSAQSSAQVAHKKIYIAGHNGMVGSAILAQLQRDKTLTILTQDRSDLDLLNQQQVTEYLRDSAPDEIYLCAAKVGGIHANNEFPAEFIYQNLVIETNVIHAAWQAGVKKLLFLGSSCIYPKICPQPMQESALLTAELEPTNQPYAIAKIAGIKICESYNRQYGTDYRCVMPTNLYGQNDNFHPQNSHVIPALMGRIHRAKMAQDETVSIWGSGQARREFLHVNDMASACVFLMETEKNTLQSIAPPTNSHVNIGSGKDVSIRELAEVLVEVIGFKGELEFDSSKPDGTPRKLLDVSRMTQLGWQYKITLKDGLQQTYQWFCENLDSIRMG